MPARPVIDTLQQQTVGATVVPQSMLKQAGFVEGEVVQINATTEVERGQAGVLNKIGGSGHAQQTEGQAGVFAVFDTGVVAGADGGEELVGGEGKAAHD